MISNIKRLSIVVAALVLLIVPFRAPGQDKQPSLTGKYTGVVKDDKGEQLTLTLDLVEEADKFSGTLTTANGSFKILKGQRAKDAVTLDIEKPGGSSGTWTLKKSGDVLVAMFKDGAKDLSVELRSAVADVISGEWEAVADAGGQAIPFVLTLKLEGEKVTGSSNSQLGTANITTGTWKDGKLSFVLEGGSGQIVMAATMVDGKLAGDFDFAGQTSGKWVAQKKK